MAQSITTFLNSVYFLNIFKHSNWKISIFFISFKETYLINQGLFHMGLCQCIVLWQHIW